MRSGAAGDQLEPRTVRGKGGYIYEQHADGALFIVAGPGISREVRLTEGSAYDAISKEIGDHPSAAGGQNTPETGQDVPEGGGWLDWFAEQSQEFGEGAKEFFENAGEHAGDMVDAWWNPAAPSEDLPVTENDKEMPDSEASGGESSPLEIALGKVGKVEYVSKHHGKGRRNKDSTEMANLKQGKDEMTVASCSPFAYWALAASGVDINKKIEGSDKSIRSILNLEKDALEERGLQRNGAWRGPTGPRCCTGI